MSTGGTMQGGRPDQPQQMQTPFQPVSQGLPPGMTGPQFGGQMGGYGSQMSPRFGNPGQGYTAGSATPQLAVSSNAPNPLLQGAMGAMGTMGATGPMGPAGAMGQQQLGQQQQVPPWAQQYADNVTARNSAPPGMSGGMGQMPGQMPIVPNQQPGMGAPKGLGALMSFDDFKQKTMDRMQRDYDNYRRGYESQMNARQGPSQQSTYGDDFVPRTPPVSNAERMSGLASLFSRLGSFR